MNGNGLPFLILGILKVTHLKHLVVFIILIALPALAAKSSRFELRIERATVVRASDVIEATATDGGHAWTLTLKISQKAKQRLADATRESIGKTLDIVINGQVVSSPLIVDEMNTNLFTLSGGLSKLEAQKLAKNLSRRPASKRK